MENSLENFKFYQKYNVQQEDKQSALLLLINILM